MIVAAVGTARLYFGVQWLTDVLGSLALGLAWVAALGLAFRRHTEPAPSWMGLAVLSGAVLALAFGLSSLASHGADIARYQPVREEIRMAGAEWRRSGWQRLASQRADLGALDSHPLNIQYAGDPKALAEILTAEGWRKGETLAPKNAVRLLSPSLRIEELPLIPHVHDGRHEDLGLVKPSGDDRRLVLRLWSTPYRIDDGAALWVGSVTAQSKRVILDLLALPSTDAGDAAPIRAAAGDFSALAPFQPEEDGPLLLTGPAPSAPHPGGRCGNHGKAVSQHLP
jgi:hypothetical protein